MPSRYSNGLQVHIHHFIENPRRDLDTHDLQTLENLWRLAGTSELAFDLARVRQPLPLEEEDILNVDAVIAQGGGDDIGIIQAFEQSGRKMPIVQGGGSSNFLKWWSEQYKKNQYQTVSANTAPGIGGAALWLAIDILNGENVPKVIKMPGASVTVENLAQYADMPPGQIVSPTYAEEWVEQNLVRKK
jgi:ABC-type sugar transport system substrate-binding protein